MRRAQSSTRCMRECRVREQPSTVGQSASLLAAECSSLLAAKGCKQADVTTAVLHFQLPALPPPSNQLAQISENMVPQCLSPRVRTLQEHSRHQLVYSSEIAVDHIHACKVGCSCP